MSSSYEIKGELRREGSIISGWCWSPTLGKHRLTVQLVLDDVAIAGTVAARLRPDLVQDGVCDGYHGFAFLLPSPSPSFSILEVRETSTGRAFGRILARSGSDLDAVKEAARQCRSALEMISGQLDAIRPRLARLQASSFASVGAFIGGSPESINALIALPQIDAVRVSVVLDYGVTTVNDVLLLAPLVQRLGLELIVLDRGSESLEIALPASKGLLYCRVRMDQCAEALATELGRGEWLVLLDSGPRSRVDADKFLRQLSVQPAVFVEYCVAELAARANVGMGFAQWAGPPPSMDIPLATRQDVLRSLGGLRPELKGGRLAILDYALRAEAAGYKVTVLPPYLGGGRSSPPDIEARRVFTKLWSK